MKLRSGYSILRSQATQYGMLTWHTALVKIDEARCIFSFEDTTGNATLGDLTASDMDEFEEVAYEFMKISTLPMTFAVADANRMVNLIRKAAKIDYELINRLQINRTMNVRGIDSIRTYCTRNVLHTDAILRLEPK